MTLLDSAHAAMLADPEDDFARLRYYRTLADTELFVLLATEAQGDTLEPQVFGLEDGPVLLAFDTEERLAGFTGMPAPYAAVPGRVMAARMAGQGLGLAVNLGAASGWIVVAPAVDWLAGVLAQAPVQARGLPVALHAPGEVDPVLAEAIALALAGAGGRASGAVLAQAAWAGDGGHGLLLACLDVAPDAEAALAQALAEALAFSGLEDGAIDLVFLSSRTAIAAQVQAIGQPLRLPKAPAAPPAAAGPAAPGMDPDRPPRLR